MFYLEKTQKRCDMKSISIVDMQDNRIITIDLDSLVFRIKCDEVLIEKRIKSYMASILYELFFQHPNPLSHDKIIDILKTHHIIVSDATRMHRKISEIRKFIHTMYPDLGDFVFNTRGVGYGLPLIFSKTNDMPINEHNHKNTNDNIESAIQTLERTLRNLINITSKNQIKYTSNSISANDAIQSFAREKIVILNECEKIILKEIRAHKADSVYMRINYILVKLKTYIDVLLPMSHSQFYSWFRQDICSLFRELKKLINFTEKI